MADEEYRLGISLSLKRARVLIYHDTLRALMDPDCFRFLINPEEKKIAIQVCKFGEDGFHITPVFPNKKFSYEISSVELLRMIWVMCGWDSQNTYRIRGNFFSKAQIVVFDCNKAQRINDADFIDSESIIVNNVN